jgi:hypothetical protein
MIINLRMMTPKLESSNSIEFMNEEIRGFIEALASVPQKISAGVGAIAGAGTAVVELTEDGMLSVPLIFNDTTLMAYELGTVFLYGMVGALGAALVNWILKRFTKKDS